MNNLESRIKAIEQRNKKVEADKAWEISWVRRLTIAFMTYVVVSVYLLVIDNDRPFLNSFIPAGGYMLSTLFLKKIRDVWQK